MDIGFIGSGPVATNLATLFHASGNTTALGHRDGPQSFARAIDGADVVTIAIPYRFCEEVLPTLASALRVKVVIDATNPLAPDYSPLALPEGRSAAEEIARILPESRVVKAFNTVFADVMHADLLGRGPYRVATFVCGDDPSAVEIVADLARAAGFDVIPFESLAAARHAEAVAHLNIAIAFGSGRGTRGAFLYVP